MNERALYRLAVERSVLRALMLRTGDGRPVAIRALAQAADVHPSTIGHLLTGTQKAVPERVAQAIADRLGVDLGVLWERDGRTARALRRMEVPA
ncbi:helix-turn-helix domain-containing protein [Streptomyces sp. 8L]|uniref:helix-turn-helix domain-containing protein n=1 Tax=Streptomyces sp. 8L TaxID=2877242 RepID=UPI001CD1A712|nr:helix-turn-helix domain-containing protein [Streptomyces sp. 8L]MCA1223853.1 helix-turn-helix transcriptional regulator [Streptomyces sp. 8L]